MMTLLVYTVYFVHQIIGAHSHANTMGIDVLRLGLIGEYDVYELKPGGKQFLDLNRNRC